MNGYSEHRRVVLALYPTTKGFGWTLFEAPLSPLDWGTVRIGKDGNGKLMRRFRAIVSRYRPTVLVLEEYQGVFRRTERIQQLCAELAEYTAQEGIPLIILRRAFVLGTFKRFGAQTRYEIGQHLTREIEAIQHLSPRKRRLWDSADIRQSMLDAAALAFAYFMAADSGR